MIKIEFPPSKYLFIWWMNFGKPGKTAMTDPPCSIRAILLWVALCLMAFFADRLPGIGLSVSIGHGMNNWEERFP